MSIINDARNKALGTNGRNLFEVGVGRSQPQGSSQARNLGLEGIIPLGLFWPECWAAFSGGPTGVF
jgi:hypothetical protein